MNKENVAKKSVPDEPLNQQVPIEDLHEKNKELAIKNQLLTEEKSELYNKLSRIEILLEAASQKVSWFEEQIKLARQQRFGKSSEKLSAIQPDLFDALGDEPTKEEDKEEAKEEETAETQTITYTRAKKKKNGRNIDTCMTTIRLSG